MSSAIVAGYRKGSRRSSTRTSITLLTAFILFVLATAGVKGFAFTLGVGTIVSLLTAVVFTQALLGSMSRTRLLRSPSVLGAAATERVRWHFDFIGASRWFFSISGVILHRSAPSPSRPSSSTSASTSSPAPGSRSALVEPTDEEGVRDTLEAAGIDGRGDPAGHRPGTRRQRLPDPDPASWNRTGSTSANEALDDGVRDRRRRLRQHQRRADLRRAGGRQRPQSADLLAAGDLRLRRLPVRPEVRGAGPDRDLPRHPDHGRRLLPDRKGGEQRNGRRLPHHLGLLALRHRSSSSTEYARTCRGCRGRRSRRSSTAR